MPTPGIASQDFQIPDDAEWWLERFNEALTTQDGVGVISPDDGENIQALRWRASRTAGLYGYSLRWLRWRDNRMGGIVFEVTRRA